MYFEPIVAIAAFSLVAFVIVITALVFAPKDRLDSIRAAWASATHTVTALFKKRP